MLLKILNKINLCTFTVTFTDLVLSFYFVTRLFNRTSQGNKNLYNEGFKQVCPRLTQHQVAAERNTESLLRRIITLLVQTEDVIFMSYVVTQAAQKHGDE